ncbi:MAG: hypothetical protein WBY22_13145, partial [Nitrososphaeraceae archaeon]
KVIFVYPQSNSSKARTKSFFRPPTTNSDVFLLLFYASLNDVQIQIYPCQLLAIIIQSMLSNLCYWNNTAKPI